jgi:hypothetical protein
MRLGENTNQLLQIAPSIGLASLWHHSIMEPNFMQDKSYSTKNQGSHEGIRS